MVSNVNSNNNLEEELGIEFALIVVKMNSSDSSPRYYCPNPQCNELIPDFYFIDRNNSTKCPRCKIPVYLDDLES